MTSKSLVTDRANYRNKIQFNGNVNDSPIALLTRLLVSNLMLQDGQLCAQSFILDPQGGLHMCAC